jgi:hypothetical protein
MAEHKENEVVDHGAANILHSALVKLASNDVSYAALPKREDNVCIWLEIRTKCKLDLNEFSILQNEVCTALKSPTPTVKAKNEMNNYLTEEVQLQF